MLMDQGEVEKLAGTRQVAKLAGTILVETRQAGTEHRMRARRTRALQRKVHQTTAHRTMQLQMSWPGSWERRSKLKRVGRTLARTTQRHLSLELPKPTTRAQKSLQKLQRKMGLHRSSLDIPAQMRWSSIHRKMQARKRSNLGLLTKTLRRRWSLESLIARRRFHCLTPMLSKMQTRKQMQTH